MKKMVMSLKKHGIEIPIVILLVVLGFLVAQKPEVNYEQYRHERKETRAPSAENSTATVSLQNRGQSSIKDSYKNLEARNIFSLDGSYFRPQALIMMTENPYTLIAILLGDEKRAVFREFTGSVVSLKVGQKLRDGAVIIRIDPLSVKTKKRGKTEEYKIFDIKPQSVKK